tara:strand:- start:433 stop:906 length:474 start_codon:yes stop_codon:yes gene_type:complete
MNQHEYTLEKISYSRKEDCRIMESVFKHWFKNPKELNFFSSDLLFPFRFKNFLQKYNNRAISYVLKHQDWIIGHISFQKKNGSIFISHLFIESKYRKLGLATIMLNEIEKFSSELSAKSISVKIISKNIKAIKLFKKLSYKIRKRPKLGFLEFLKKV